MNWTVQLRDSLWRARQVRHAYWSARRALSMPTTKQNEIIYRIHCRSLARKDDNHFFEFPWGMMEYLDAANLRTQFEQIFLRRQYAFTTTVEDPVIVDCGGNIGLSALWFKLHHPGCRLTVYEADARIAQILRGNLARAGFDNVQVNPQAVWTENKLVQFDARGLDRGAIHPEGALSVPAVDLAEVLPAQVDLLKLDIEGAEFAVLEHLCATGAIARVSRMIVEFHLTEDKARAFPILLQRLQGCGLTLAIGGAGITTGLGHAREPSPFEIIGAGSSLVMVYAWRGGNP